LRWRRSPLTRRWVLHYIPGKGYTNARAEGSEAAAAAVDVSSPLLAEPILYHRHRHWYTAMYPRVEGAPNRVLTVYPRAAAQKVFSSRCPGLHHPKTPTIHYRRRRRNNPLDGLVYNKYIYMYIYILHAMPAVDVTFLPSRKCIYISPPTVQHSCAMDDSWLGERFCNVNDITSQPAATVTRHTHIHAACSDWIVAENV